MKFILIILRIKSFWTAFAVGIIFVSILSDANHCSSSHIPEVVETSARQPAEENIPEVAREDYAVYSAVLRQMRLSETVVVGEFAVDSDPNQLLYLGHSVFSEDTLNNYQSKNREIRKLRREFDFKTEVTLLGSEEESTLFPKDEGGWGKFYEAYPKARGIIYFSNVGFNKNKDQAMVRVKFQSGYSSEKQDFHFLKLIDGKWEFAGGDSRETIMVNE